MNDIIIGGAGIVGLATAYQLLKKSPLLKVVILEKESGIARHQTGHNSGVIHSGIYYKAGSQKAENCREGYQLLINFCDEFQVPYELCGKVIVATDEKEFPQLDLIYERGISNGLNTIRKLNREELVQYEPNVAGIAGIHVPQTGIISYTSVCEELQKQILLLGGEIHFNEKIVKIEHNHGINSVTESSSYSGKLFVNCCGLYSDKIAQLDNQADDLKIIPFRGEYYMLKPEKSSLVRNLIYPVPDPNFPFLGVHFTRMIGGGVEAGPNAVFAFKREGYKKTDFSWDETWDSLSFAGFRKVALKYWKTGLGEFYRSYSKSAFTHALQKLIPSISEDDLIPGGSGVRAQACSIDGSLLDDFKIIKSRNTIHVVNAPSPAATSSLAIGKRIAQESLALLT